MRLAFEATDPLGISAPESLDLAPRRSKVKRLVARLPAIYGFSGFLPKRVESGLVLRKAQWPSRIHRYSSGLPVVAGHPASSSRTVPCHARP